MVIIFQLKILSITLKTNILYIYFVFGTNDRRRWRKDKLKLVLGGTRE